MDLTFRITNATVLSLSGPDQVLLAVASRMHGEYHAHNTNALTVRTARGNGEACLFGLGWRGDYDYITSDGLDKRAI